MDRTSKLFLRNLPENFTMGDSYAEALLLREYGAIFVARGGAVPPDRVIFGDAEEVERFQGKIEVGREVVDGITMELQAPAMEALKAAISFANDRGLSITPRGADSARRGYEHTVELWASRVEPALDHWTALGRLTHETAKRIRNLQPFEQVAEVLALEKEEIWFAKDLTKSIIYSVAPPGASQHLALLAFDIKEYADPEVRAILAETGWFRTVVSDLPHFTYLGVKEMELRGLGLKNVESNGEPFWVPDI